MNKRKTSLILSVVIIAVICAAFFASCEKNEEKDYTVTFKNYDGTVLTTQKIKEGETPVYEGNIPSKPADEQYSYVFAGWTPAISKVSADATYTATFTSNVNAYTVTWKNYDGQILKTDANVPYGSTPVYTGETPKRNHNGNTVYYFSGWNPAIGEVKGNASYTAQYVEKNVNDLNAGIDPVIADDNKTMLYGLYPQTRVSDEALITQLNSLTPSNVNGWVLYNGEYFAKETAKVYNNENYFFDDGAPIVNGSEYWFKCEPIRWQILSNGSGSYYLLSSKLLDVCKYYADYDNRIIDGNTVFANNYGQSDIRNWLNGEFFNSAFALNDTYVQQTIVNNKAASTNAANNEYACADTQDKVYLPCYADYINTDLGFTAAAETSPARQCKTTDYARVRGAWCNTTKALSYNGSYWTRSPSAEFYYCAWNVNSGGVLSEYVVNGSGHCVRPCITVTF